VKRAESLEVKAYFFKRDVGAYKLDDIRCVQDPIDCLLGYAGHGFSLERPVCVRNAQAGKFLL